MKKIFLSIVIFILCIQTHTFADDIKIYIDDVLLSSSPVLENDRVLVPVRSIFEYMQAEVLWDNNTGTILINSENSSIFLSVGSDIASRGSSSFKLDSPVKIIRDRSYIPLRGAAQLLFCITDWNEDNRCVNIYKNTLPPISDRYNYIYEYEIFTLINNIRISAGISPLEWSSELSFAGRLHAEDMSARNFFDHTNPDGKSPFERLNEFGIMYSYAGENIAQGYFTPSNVTDNWMNSEPHRENILNPVFKKMGVGFYKGYWVQEFSN